MSEKYLQREDAPFDAALWGAIDATVVGAAKSWLSGRRLLGIEGPYGLGLKWVPTKDATVATKGYDGVTVSAAYGVPVALIQASFSLAARDIASFEQTHLPIDLGPVAAAAIGCARQEDDIVFHGLKALSTEGLLTAKKTQSLKLSAWTNAGAAAKDVLKAVATLEKAGFNGPYALGLEPELYNSLLRLYPQTDGTELEHISEIVTGGVIKAPGITEGGVLLAVGTQYATIILGQDMAAGFVGPQDGSFLFSVVETVTLRLARPETICVLK